MMSWFRKDPLAQLQKKYQRLLLEARDLQRNGDIVSFASKSAEAEAVLQEMDRLKASSTD